MHQLGKGIWEQLKDPSLVRNYNAVEILENTQKHLKAMIFPHTVEIPKFPEDGQEMYFEVVGSFPTREEAIKYARDTFGADEEGKISLIGNA
jgi:hypothetical protein